MKKPIGILMGILIVCALVYYFRPRPHPQTIPERTTMVLQLDGLGEGYEGSRAVTQQGWERNKFSSLHTLILDGKIVVYLYATTWSHKEDGNRDNEATTTIIPGFAAGTPYKDAEGHTVMDVVPIPTAQRVVFTQMLSEDKKLKGSANFWEPNA